MTAKQKVIKYLALAFAVFLIVSIALGAFELLSSLLGMEVLKTPGTGYLYSNVLGDEVSTLDIDISVTELKIVEGETFSLNTDNENVMFYQDGAVLSIRDKERFSFTPDGAIVIEVPSDREFSDVSINAGAGEITISTLQCSSLTVSLGAGDFYARSLYVSSSADIDCAAGEFTVRDGSINNLQMNMAIGDVSLDCFLGGETEIDCGLGDLNILLHGSTDDYSIEVDKGICSARLNAKTMEDERVYGSGVNKIEINGAAGDISIKTKE